MLFVDIRMSDVSRIFMYTNAMYDEDDPILEY